MSTFVILALLVVIISIVRSVMKPGLGEGAPGRPQPRGSSGSQGAASNASRAPQAAPRPVSSASRTTQQPAPRTATQRAARSNSSAADPSSATRDAMASDASSEAMRRMIEQRETSNRRLQEQRSSEIRDAARREAAARDAGSDWYIVLDVPRDARRAEILSAVKLRIERARHAGDAQAIPRILRAAENGMGSMGTKGLRELARKLGTGG